MKVRSKCLTIWLFIIETIFLTGVLMVPTGLNSAKATDSRAAKPGRNGNFPAVNSEPSLPLVYQWDIFEESFVGEPGVANAFADVELNVTYQRPDGSTIDFLGFYQGQGRWKFRFMPDRPGVWQYQAKFSNGVAGPSGSFRCVASIIPGLISQDTTNPVWFGYKSGKPALIRALHVGDRFFASQNNSETGEPWNAPRRTAFLDWAQAQGYNTLSIAGHLLRREEKGRGRGWNTPDLWDAARGRPNPEAYDQMENILDDLKQRSIIVYPFAGFFGRSASFPADPAGQEVFLKYTIARLAPYWNLMFMIGGPEPLLKGKTYFEKADIHRLGQKISELDPFEHLLSVHNPTGDDAFKDAAWHTYGILQGPKTLDRKQLAAGLLKNHHPEKPLLAQETLWSGNTFHIRQTRGGYRDDDLRKNAYVILLSAAALVFADNNGNSSSGFSGSMDLKHCRQERHNIIKQVWDFFETIPFYRLKPCPDLITSAEGANAFCLAEPGHYYLFYLDAAGRLSARLTGGPFQATWINAQNTSENVGLGTVSQVTQFASPAGGDDWLLWLTKAPSSDKCEQNDE